jgi:hypothetical protein
MSIVITRTTDTRRRQEPELLTDGERTTRENTNKTTGGDVTVDRQAAVERAQHSCRQLAGDRWQQQQKDDRCCDESTQE